MHDPIVFTSLFSSYYKTGRVEAVQVTTKNFRTVEIWLDEHGNETSVWTNESFVIGLWIYGAWHDSYGRTPMPFGWWVYRTEDGDIGVASPEALEEHYAPAR